MFTHTPVDIPEVKTKNVDRKRFYVTPNGVYPSITTVLNVRKREGLAQWRKRVGHDVANYIARTAATRGTKVHHMCEDFLNNQEVEKDNREFLPWCLFQQLKPVIEKNIDNIFAQECDFGVTNIKLLVGWIALQNIMENHLSLTLRLLVQNVMMSIMSHIIFRQLHMQKCLKNEQELKSIKS